MPSVATAIDAFIKRFDPERVRAVLLNPNQVGDFTDASTLSKRLADLHALPRTEVIAVDGREKQGNGLIYADFFDFT
ncbi:MAG: hypothetical protein NXI21_17175 [Alphaproteobacteria bacterium]|nr:hypothetical protein [Alphaproteobacteria bacterium]